MGPGGIEPERVDIVDVDDYTEPAAEPGYYAIYLRLSREPSAAWRERFAEEWRRLRAVPKRRMRIVRERLRIEISGDDLVQEQLETAADLVDRTNRSLAASRQKKMKESAGQD
ncbi:MAG: hypothetical protein FWJ73_04545 [Limnochordales bacterium]|nr:hypothetical protein [Bacillota bacterium]